MFACDGSVTTVEACASVNRTPPAANRSIHGVDTERLPDAPIASARKVSIVMRRTFCEASRRAGADPPHADRNAAARITAKVARIAIELTWRADRLSSDRADSADDVRGGNAEAIEELFGFSATRDLADGEAMDREPGVGDRGRNRVADAAHRIVIFDGNQVSTGRTRGRDEPVAIDRRDGIEIDDADWHPARLQLVVRLQRLEHGDAGADDRGHVIAALAQHLQSADRERLVV